MELKIKVRAEEGCVHTAGRAPRMADFHLIQSLQPHVLGWLYVLSLKKFCICSIALHLMNGFHNINGSIMVPSADHLMFSIKKWRYTILLLFLFWGFFSTIILVPEKYLESWTYRFVSCLCKQNHPVIYLASKSKAMVYDWDSCQNCDCLEWCSLHLRTDW